MSSGDRIVLFWAIGVVLCWIGCFVYVTACKVRKQKYKVDYVFFSIFGGAIWMLAIPAAVGVLLGYYGFKLGVSLQNKLADKIRTMLEPVEHPLGESSYRSMPQEIKK